VIQRKNHDLTAARAEFLADVAVEPDVPFNFEELGSISAAEGENRDAEKYLREALRLEPRLAAARYSLAKLYRSESRYKEALGEAEEALKSDDQSASLHYLLAQLLQKLNRSPDALREFAISARLRDKIRDDLELKISGHGFQETGLAP